MSQGIPIFSLDTDGDCSEFVPLYMGAIDKREIALGKDAIDRELERIIPMFRDSGYIAALDHLVPPDVSYQDFR